MVSEIEFVEYPDAPVALVDTSSYIPGIHSIVEINYPNKCSGLRVVMDKLSELLLRKFEPHLSFPRLKKNPAAAGCFLR